MHLMVDPGYITLGCIPFLLIRGLPRAAAIHNCIYMPRLLNIASNGSSPPSTTSATTQCLAMLFIHPLANSTDQATPSTKLPMPEDQFNMYLVSVSIRLTMVAMFSRIKVPN